MLGSTPNNMIGLPPSGTTRTRADGGVSCNASPREMYPLAGSSSPVRPILLDLFCGAGGCSVGYHRAGFDVVGVDVKAQPLYPFTFEQGDAIEAMNRLLAGGNVAGRRLSDFDAVHASPPCQKYSVLAAMHRDIEYPDLIDETRQLLLKAKLPFVIENVEPAPLARESGLFSNGVLLCGSMFGLGVERGQLRRHRAFETTFRIAQPRCSHVGKAVGVYGHGGHSGKHRMLYRAEAAIALGIDWMSRDEMTQAIPPSYTEYIGRQLLRVVKGGHE